MTVTSTRRAFWTGRADTGEIAHWDAVATQVAATLAEDAFERDQANAVPEAEAQLLRDSGLVDLLLPSETGGAGGHWESALRAVRILARVDGSIAQLLGYHYINSGNIIFGARDDVTAEAWLRRSAQHSWIWGDSVNPTDPDLTLTAEGSGWVLTGTKRYSTGSAVGDALLVNATISGGEHDGRIGAVVLEKGRAGVEYVDDWDFLGQRLSASNTVKYHGVTVDEADLLGFVEDVPFGTLLTPGIQLVFGNLYLGLAEGALQRGVDIVRARPKGWVLSSAPTYREDPLIQRLIGELDSRRAAVEALADKLNAEFDDWIGHSWSLTAEQRAQAEIDIARLKVVSSDLATDVTHQIFEATGTSSTRTGVGLDLFWRNARTHSLHDPVDYKRVEVGANLLNGEVQPITLYT